MSYSSKVKEELISIESNSRHCLLAELCGFIVHISQIELKNSIITRLIFSSEYEAIMIKCFTILKKIFKIDESVNYSKSSLSDKKYCYKLIIEDDKTIRQVLLATKLIGRDGSPDMEQSNFSLLLSGNCCKRAFIRAVFLSRGSISNPEKAYHLEFSLDTDRQARSLQAVIASFDLDIKLVVRKKNYVLYLKEAEQIAQLLGLMGASLALMDFENIRIVKDVRNAINRKFNCEMANLNKTVLAAVKQLEGIKQIRDRVGLDSLSPALREVALIRLEFPDASLAELTEKLEGSLSKSGLNHRLRKLLEISESL